MIDIFRTLILPANVTPLAQQIATQITNVETWINQRTKAY